MIHKSISVTDREVFTLVDALDHRLSLMHDGIRDKEGTGKDSDWELEECYVIRHLIEKIGKPVDPRLKKSLEEVIA